MQEQWLLNLPPGLMVRSGKFHLRFRVAGIQYRVATGCEAIERNLSAALKRLHEERERVGRGESISQLRPRQFSEAVQPFIDWKFGECREHPATAKRTATSLVSCKSFFGATMLHRITPGMVENYKAWRRSCKIAEVTIRHDLHALSQFFQYAIKQDWCRFNVIRSGDISIPSDKDAQRTYVLTAAEEELYFMSAAARPMLVDGAMVMLHSGMRPNEVLELRVDDLNLTPSAETATIRNGKTEAARRTLALVPEALDVLRRRALSAVGGRLFVGERGGQNSLLHTLDAWHSKVMDETGMAFVIYAFRHTFATRMAVNGCPLATLAEILGHSGLRCVGRYLHPGQAAQEDAMRRYQKCDHFCARTARETPVLGISGDGVKGMGPLTPNN